MKEEISKPKTLFLKLLEIQKRVDSFTKDKKSGTGAFGYEYVSGSQVLSVIRPLMNELGLILKPEVIDIENSRQDYKTRNGEKSEILTKVKQRYTWIDCDSGEKEICEWGANGQNEWEKGLGSALTYGERYFLLKFFHVPTDEDDVDNASRKKETQKKNELKWLNVVDKAGNETDVFKKILARKEKGEDITIDTLKIHFKLSNETIKFLIEKGF